MSTAFFNRGNRGVVRDLLDLLKEANQEVPAFLESIAREGAGFGGGGGRGGRTGGRGRGSAAMKDVRTYGGGQRPAYGAGMGMGGYGGGGGMGGGAGYGAPGGGMGGGGGYGGGYGNPSGPGGSSWW